MQINAQNDDKIILKIIYEQIPTEFQCVLNEILENPLIAFANVNKLNYKSIYFLYSGSSLLSTQLKKPISEIIKPRDKIEKRMILLAYALESDIIQEDEIIIILSIESVKIVKLNGNKGEKIKDIVKNSIKLDLNWCTFKYRNIEIDLEQKFDNIANDEDKKQLKIDLSVNYTIPLIVNLAYEKKIYTIQCFLGDRIYYKVQKYFEENHLDLYDFNLFYENKEIQNYYSKIFYEIISDDKIQNSIDNENIDNNIIKSFPIGMTLNESDLNLKNKEKITVIPINEITKRKIEIEIKIIQKPCCVRYKRKISKCCSDFKDCLGDCCKCTLLAFAGILGFAIGLFIVFVLFGGWLFFL